ncbi:MAG: hypothetical protein DWQ02_03255, partial [Bacteroidetes bacterium]
MSFGISQSNKPDSGKNFPTFIKINYHVSPEQKDVLFEEYLQLSEGDGMQLISSQQDDLGYTHDK